jgi:acyl-CoA thioesterase
MSPEEIAQACGRVMYAEDNTARGQGIELVEVRPGYARVRMHVRKEHTNSHGTCHGGFIFLLADTAFAYSCNSRNRYAVAAAAAIEFVAPASEGDTLTAEGVEQHDGRRGGVYDIRVTDAHGKLIALFRGRSATISGKHHIGEAA